MSLPLPALDALRESVPASSQLRLLVGIDRLFHAGRTGGSVSSLKAAMQAVVPQHPVAVAVAGLLVQHRRDSRGHLVRVT